MKKLLERFLALIRKNKVNPYKPDVEVNLGPVVKRIITVKKKKREPPKF